MLALVSALSGLVAGIVLDELLGAKVLTGVKLELAKLRVAVASDVASLLKKLSPSR